MCAGTCWGCDGVRGWNAKDLELAQGMKNQISGEMVRSQGSWHLDMDSSSCKMSNCSVELEVCVERKLVMGGSPWHRGKSQVCSGGAGQKSL